MSNTVTQGAFFYKMKPHDRVCVVDIESASIDAVDDDEYNGGGFVEISVIFVKQLSPFSGT